LSSQEESLFIDELTWYAEEKRISLAVLIKDVSSYCSLERRRKDEFFLGIFLKVPEGVHVLKGELRE